LDFTYSGGRRRELGFCSGFTSGCWMRSVLLLQSVDVKDGEAGVGIGIFYIDESGSLLFLLLFFSGFRFAGEVSVGFLFLLSCERVEAWAMLRMCSFPLLVAVPVMAVLFFMFSSLRMLLLCFLCLLVLWSGASGSGIWMAHIQGGCWWLWGQIVGSDDRFPFNEYFLRFTKAWCPTFDLFWRDGWFDVPGCR